MTTHLDPQLNDADLELLSAYIDRRLADGARAALERRLEREPGLRSALDELRATVALLRELEPARPPRSFTLDPAAVAPRRAWSFPWRSLGSAVIALFLLVAFGTALLRTIGGAGTPAAPAASIAVAPTAAVERSAAESMAATAAPPAAPAAAAAAPIVAPTAAGAAADRQPQGTPELTQAQNNLQGAATAAPEMGAAGSTFLQTTSAPATPPSGAEATSAPYAALPAASPDSAGLSDQAPPPTNDAAGGGAGSVGLIAGAIVLVLLIALGGLVVWRRR